MSLNVLVTTNHHKLDVAFDTVCVHRLDLLRQSYVRFAFREKVTAELNFLLPVINILSN